MTEYEQAFASLGTKWANEPDDPRHPTYATEPVCDPPRRVLLCTAAEALRGATDAVANLGEEHPAAAQAIVRAMVQTLSTVALTIEGLPGGPLTRAVELLGLASSALSEPIGARRTRSADVNQFVSLLGELAVPRRDEAMLAMLLDIVDLANRIAAIRQRTTRVAGPRTRSRWHNNVSAPTSPGRGARVPVGAGRP